LQKELPAFVLQKLSVSYAKTGRLDNAIYGYFCGKLWQFL
jgi:hypothetical protein